MSSIKIEAIKNEDKVSANGKNYIRCSILTKTKQGEELWISGFGNETTKSWVKGQQVDLEIYPEDYNGKTYWKFKEVAEISVLGELNKINSKLDLLLSSMNTPKSPENVPEVKNGLPIASPQAINNKEVTVDEVLDIIG